MKVLNKYGLPEPFVRMAQDDDDHKPKDKWYSITQLLKPTRQILLERRHYDEIEVDVADRVFQLFGSACHYILQSNANGTNEFAEERLNVTLENGYTVSGQIDLYNIDTGKVEDYKTASVWKAIYNDVDDWRKQGQGYAWLLKQHGLPCSSAQFTGFLKDHSKREARTKADYPKHPVKPYTFAVTDESIAEIDKYIRDKIDDLRANEGVSDDNLPLCTEEERWNDGKKYAVYKGKKTRAERVLNSQEEAEQWLKANGGDRIVERPGEDKRCVDYCDCCKFCNYWQEHYGKGEEDNAEN